MKNFINNIKAINNLNNLLKLYIIIFFLMNIVYWCLEFYKDKLRNLFVLENNNIHFDRILYLSNITTNLELLIIFINILLLIIFIFKDRYKNFTKDRDAINNVKEYLITNIILIISVSIISFIPSVIFSIHYGNLIQQLIWISEITFIALIYYGIITTYRLLISKIRKKENR